jgi:DNA invertase Pin-like site-specific DNA recombinase
MEGQVTRLRAVIYARVSGDQQRRDGTIQTQLAKLPKWIESMGWDHVGTYTDDGKSASKNLEARGDFARLRADAERKAFDVVVWVDQDRASRSEDWGEFGSIISTFQRNGIKLAEPDVGLIEPGTMAGNMTIFMKWQRSMDENRVRRNKTMDGKHRMAREVGGHAFGRIPYGLRWDARVARVVKSRPADGSPHPGWSIDPHEGAICREIHARFNAGESGHEIARDLMRRKEPTRRGGKWFDPVNRILTSAVYRGEIRYHGIPVAAPVIIDEDTWFKSQALLSTSKKRGLPQTRHIYLAEGLGMCSACGSPMYIRGTTTRTEGNVTYYVCRDRCDTRVDLKKRCELPRFRTDTIDEAIWCDVAHFLSQPRAKIIAAIRGHEKAAAEETAAWMADVKRVQEQLGALDAAVAVYMDQLDARMITAEQFKAHAAKSTVKRRMLQEQLKNAEAALDSTGTSRAAMERLETFLDEWRELVRTATVDERRALLCGLVKKGDLVFDAHGVNVRMVLSSDKTTAIEGCSVAEPAVTLRVVAR